MYKRAGVVLSIADISWQFRKQMLHPSTEHRCFQYCLHLRDMSETRCACLLLIDSLFRFIRAYTKLWNFKYCVRFVTIFFGFSMMFCIRQIWNWFRFVLSVWSKIINLIGIIFSIIFFYALLILSTKLFRCVFCNILFFA